MPGRTHSNSRCWRRASYERAFYHHRDAAAWRGNLDTLNDILRGGFGTPEDGFTIRWHNAQLSREELGYQETVRQLEARLARCHPENQSAVAAELQMARLNQGPTVFDWLVEIIRNHGPGGAEGDDNVLLDLIE